MTAAVSSVRARVARITAILLAVVLVPGALLLAFAVATTERSALDRQLRETADEVVTLVNENRVPTTLPVSGARMVQVVEPDGTVVAASPAADRMISLLSAEEMGEAGADGVVEVPAARVAEAGTLRVLAVSAGPETRPSTVLVAASVPDTRETQAALWIGLALGVALVLAVGGYLSWRAVGTALQPVEELRRGADRIGQGGEHLGEGRPARLPVPGTRDEVEALAVTLNGMLDRLDAAAATQRRFVSDAAHELRSPVASLRMQLEVAHRLGEGDELPADLLPDVDCLGRLVDDLLLLARAGSPSSTHHPEMVDLRDILAEVVARYDRARVPVRLDASAEDDIDMSVDPLGVERAVVNLVDNAVRHATSEVRVTVGVESDRAVIEVRDDGIGIAEGDRERVFDRFTRLDDARARDAGGSGLGLPIVRELLRPEGGEVSLHDNAPGLLARVTLPRTRASAQEQR